MLDEDPDEMTLGRRTPIWQSLNHGPFKSRAALAKVLVPAYYIQVNVCPVFLGFCVIAGFMVMPALWLAKKRLVNAWYEPRCSAQISCSGMIYSPDEAVYQTQV